MNDRVDLTGARLPGGGDCHFTRSNLSRADLRGANLSHAAFDEETVLTGAVFDERTRLPFSQEEALRRGMVYKAD